MTVLVTGSSSGIGKATVEKFIAEGHLVVGIDLVKSGLKHARFIEFIADVSNPETLPDIRNIDILINNAGTTEEQSAIQVNLIGAIRCTLQYGIQKNIKSIVNVVSASAHSGAEFPMYVASKGGLLAYTKYTALQIAQYGATCNSISPGGVLTPMNDHILNSPQLWQRVLDETMLNKWASAQEIAEWIYFVAVVNKSMTGQDILVDNGEMSKATFVW